MVLFANYLYVVQTLDNYWTSKIAIGSRPPAEATVFRRIPNTNSQVFERNIAVQGWVGVLRTPTCGFFASRGSGSPSALGKDNFFWLSAPLFLIPRHDKLRSKDFSNLS